MGTIANSEKNYFVGGGLSKDPNAKPTPMEEELLSMIRKLEERLESVEGCKKVSSTAADMRAK